MNMDINNKREITLMVYSRDMEEAEEKLKEIEKYCKEKNIYYQEKERRLGVCYDFTIRGNTNDYAEITKYFGDTITETSFAELGNKYDMPDDEFIEWTTVLRNLYLDYVNKDKLFEKFFEMMMKVENVEFLEDIKKYTMKDKYSDILLERINHKKGLKNSFQIYTEQLSIKQELRNKLEQFKLGTLELSAEDIDGIIELLN